MNFLGANFDGFDQAGGLGVAHGVTMNFYAGQAGNAMSSTARAHSRYRQSKNAIAYSDEDRKNSREDEVK